jgi:hypothetical protein
MRLCRICRRACAFLFVCTLHVHLHARAVSFLRDWTISRCALSSDIHLALEFLIDAASYLTVRAPCGLDTPYSLQHTTATYLPVPQPSAACRCIYEDAAPFSTKVPSHGRAGECRSIKRGAWSNLRRSQ